MQKEAEQSDNENSLINDDAKIGLVSDQKKNLPRSSKSKKYRREGSTVSPVRKESIIIKLLQDASNDEAKYIIRFL